VMITLSQQRYIKKRSTAHCMKKKSCKMLTSSIKSCIIHINLHTRTILSVMTQGRNGGIIQITAEKGFYLTQDFRYIGKNKS